MSKIYPQLQDILSSSHSPSSSRCSSKIEVFTIWMKSLVMHGNGCTVFDSIGEVAYRIDNYGRKKNNEVHLMDVNGKVLSTILRKKLRLFGRWEGSKSGNVFNGKPWFQVRKFLNHGLGMNVTLRSELEQTDLDSYRMERLEGCSKLSCKIVDVQTGRIVAELKQKQSSGGVVLGDDVMGLVVEPNVDHSFIMGLIVVHGLVNGKM
ncbi:hypothetical protein MKW92_018238 [Papaver armeniacum]|nr:hypothetical protein MKW92_018238 [Papaver armeniacum]